MENKLQEELETMHSSMSLLDTELEIFFLFSPLLHKRRSMTLEIFLSHEEQAFAKTSKPFVCSMAKAQKKLLVDPRNHNH